MRGLIALSEWLNAAPLGALWALWRAALFGVLLAFILAAFRRLPPSNGGARSVMWLSTALLLAIWLYQAQWQLAGFAQPRFVQFLRRYDRRPWAETVRPRRGAILDAQERPLALDAEGVRRYPLGRAAAHPIGFCHPQFGSAGVERANEADLEGRRLETREDIRRFGRNLIRNKGIVGNDLLLTLHAELQQDAFTRLTGRRGAVVALDPQTGAIRALVSAPAFDPSNPSAALTADPQEAPMLNRALHARYPPGSTFKILAAAAAIQSGFRGILHCPAEGYAPEPGVRPIRDHEYYAALEEGRRWRGYGAIDLREAFVRSSNVYFAQWSSRREFDWAVDMARRAGWISGIEIFRGSDGVLASVAGYGLPSPPVSPRLKAQIAIGQGPLLVTPLHMAVIAAAIAREGWIQRPTLDARAAPELMGRLCSSEVAREVAGLMREAVKRGTGRAADRPGLEIAGKTGTAENPLGAPHAWFTGFAPAPAPRLVVVVLIENGGYGGRVAAPIAGDLFETASRLGLLGERRSGAHP